MAAKKKRVDPIKQREKRAKIAAIVGGVLFLGVAAYEVPSLMKMMHPKPPPSAHAHTSTATGTSPLSNVASPTTGTTAPSGQLVDSDVPPTTAEDGQLVSFDVFQTKNPFAPQVTSSAASSSSSSSSSDAPGATTPTDTSSAPKPATTKPVATPPQATSTTPTQTTPAPTPPASTTPTSTTPTSTTPVAPTVAVSVNGTVSHVSVDNTFPTSAPVFRLVSFAKGTAQIAIVGGSYESGDQTLTLQQGKPVTLENQTTGTRYKLELVATP